jgi:hypothetical protein
MGSHPSREIASLLDLMMAFEQEHAARAKGGYPAIDLDFRGVLSRLERAEGFEGYFALTSEIYGFFLRLNESCLSLCRHSSPGDGRGRGFSAINDRLRSLDPFVLPVFYSRRVAAIVKTNQLLIDSLGD